MQIVRLKALSRFGKAFFIIFAIVSSLLILLIHLSMVRVIKFFILVLFCGYMFSACRHIDPVDEEGLSRDAAMALLKEYVDANLTVFVSKKPLPPKTKLAYDYGPGPDDESFGRRVFYSPDCTAWLAVFFTMPYADIPSPFIYIYVSVTDGSLTISEEPGLVDGYKELFDIYKQPPISGAETRSSVDVIPMSRSANTSKWAVIISGGGDKEHNYFRYWNDCADIYSMLTGIYGYSDDHIVVLMSDGTNTAEDRRLYNGYDSSPQDLNGDGIGDIDEKATISSIEATFTLLGNLVQPDDEVLIYTTDHGLSANGHSYLLLWFNQTMSDTDFATQVNKITNLARVYVIMAQCYSGGFISELARTNRVISTSCDSTEVAYALSTDGIGPNHSRFGMYWYHSLRGYDAFGMPVNADLSIYGGNGDNVVSFKEAFSYADYMINSTWPGSQTPQYNSTPAYLGDLCTPYGMSLLNPQIIGSDNISTTASQSYSVSGIPSSASVTWSTTSNNIVLVSSGTSCTVSNTCTDVYSTASIKVTAVYSGVTRSTTKTIHLWKPGNNYADNYILGDFSNSGGSFSLAYDLNTGPYTWSSDSDSVIFGLQGMSYVNYSFDAVTGEEPSEVRVSFDNPLGESTTIIKSLDVQE